MTREVDKGRELETRIREPGQRRPCDLNRLLFSSGEVIGFKQRAMADLLDLGFENLLAAVW